MRNELANRISRRLTGLPPRTRSTIRPGVEPLEGRAMLATGVLDPAFGAGGLLALNPWPGTTLYIRAVAVQADGRIVAVGSTAPVQDLPGGFKAVDLAIARFDADGSLDVSFGGGDGVATLDLTDEPSRHDRGEAVAILPDGRIAVVASSTSAGSLPGTVQPATPFFTTLRVAPDGSLDPTYGAAGLASRPFLIQTNTISNFPTVVDSSLVANGGLAVGGYFFTIAGRGGLTRVPYLFRVSPDGRETSALETAPLGLAADSSSGGSNLIVLSGPPGRRPVAVQPDGKIVVAGRPNGRTAPVDFIIGRFNPDGSLDPTFGVGGRSVVAFDLVPRGVDIASALAIQADGKIVIVGEAQSRSGRRFAAARLNPDGSLDASFDRDGRATVDFKRFSVADASASAVAIGNDGRILLGGVADVPIGARRRRAERTPNFVPAFARLEGNGKPSRRFGTGGRSILRAVRGLSFAGADLPATAIGPLAIQGPSGRLFLAIIRQPSATRLARIVLDVGRPGARPR